MQSIAFWRLAGYTSVLRDHYQLILVDDRGHGHSAKPRDASGYVMERRVGDLVAVLDDLGIEQAHFWGFSLGGYIGFGMMTLEPSRLRAVAIGGSHPFPLEAAKIDQAIASLKLGVLHYVEEAEASAGRLPEPYRSHRLANDSLALVANMIARRDLMGSFDMGLVHGQSPVYLYAGTEDAIHDQLRTLAAAHPACVFKGIPGLDHGGTFMRSELVLPHVMTFLAR